MGLLTLAVQPPPLPWLVGWCARVYHGAPWWKELTIAAILGHVLALGAARPTLAARSIFNRGLLGARNVLQF